MYKIGFACKWLHHDRTLKPKQLREHEEYLNQKATTVRWLNEHKDQAEEKLWDLMRHNIASIHAVMRCCVASNPTVFVLLDLCVR